MSIIFIAGIDTGIGKSFVTGLLAAFLKNQGRSVITAKLVQTGCQGLSEDILIHRHLMNTPLLPEDEQGLTCPYVFPLAASPHLAAGQAGQPIDKDHLLQTFATLQQTYEMVLVEGAGGLQVPLDRTFTILDLLSQTQWPSLMVTSTRLGSINHTWLSLDALAQRSLTALGLACIQDRQTPEIIARDTEALFQTQWPHLPLVGVPWMETTTPFKMPDFSPWLTSFPSSQGMKGN